MEAIRRTPVHLPMEVLSLERVYSPKGFEVLTYKGMIIRI